MPISLPAMSRRQFLAGSLAAGAGLLVRPRAGWGADEAPSDPHRFALLSDMHIAAQREEPVRGVRMDKNLEAVGREILALSGRPGNVLVGGDCAYLHGRSEDYAVLVELLRPVREAGLPVHLVLGNHDHRERFRDALTHPEPDAKPAERHTAVIESPRANWFLLDSLDQTNHTPGVLGEGQCQWLARQLDRRPDTPALILVHHNPDDREKTNGLTDTRQLFAVLAPRRQVKAVFYGHTHNWSLGQRDGLHLVNLPPTAYVFGPGRPNGWVDARLSDTGCTLELRCLDPQHAQHGQRVELEWRTA